jgi:hypothetical protein
MISGEPKSIEDYNMEQVMNKEEQEKEEQDSE